MAALARLFLKSASAVSLFTISVEPPVDGAAKSIISFGIGIVLLRRLTTAVTFAALALLPVAPTMTYF